MHVSRSSNCQKKWGEEYYLPVLSIAGQHHWVFRFADFTGIIIFDLLDIFLSLYAIIFRECTLVTGSAGMRKKMRANRLNAALGGC